MNAEIVNYAKQNNLIITEDALRHLNIYNYKKIINKLKEQDILFVTAKQIDQINKEETIQKTKEYKKNFRIIEKYDITGKELSQGSVEDFQKLFLHKYEVLSNIIKTRPNFEFTSISAAKRLAKNKPVDIIGMVYEKRLSKNGNLILKVDDPTDTVMLVVMNKDEDAFLKAKEILLDNVIGFKCSVISNNMLIVNEYIYPDIPFKKDRAHTQEDVNVAIIGDLHIGSKLFREKEFFKFIEWLNGNVDDDKELAQSIKYLIIAGDVVDGIGVYPAQFDELAITDIYEQYKLFEEYILKIRDDIEIFITSGNHDAVRLSDPQPAIKRELIGKLYEKENIHILGSPTWIDIENNKVLVYHGASIHGIYSEIKGSSMERPDEGMREVLKRRDLMPQFGQRQTFVPIEKNFMIIPEVPDLFITADVHHHAYSKYKNTHLICTSCWQTITEYQKQLGHNPTISKVVLYNFKDEKVKVKDFKEEGED